MSWLAEAAGEVESWFGPPATTGVEPEIDMRQMVFEDLVDGPAIPRGGGGLADRIARAVGHYSEDVEWEPEVPVDRPELDQAQLDERILDMSGALIAPTPEDADGVVTSLVDMSDAQRAVAVGQMTDEEIIALTDALPAGDERLEQLVNATSNPKHKLLLWAAGERGELAREERNAEKLPQSTEDETLNAMVARRVNSARHGQAEISDEVEHALDELDKAATPAQRDQIVKDLMERKEKERDIERRLGIDITNDAGGVDENGLPTPRAHWSKPELDQMELVLDKLPADAVEESPDLKEIRRSVVDYDDSGVAAPDTLGDHGDGVITIFDATTTSATDHHGDTSALGGFTKVSSLQQTLAHEIGHNVNDNSQHEAMRGVVKAAGWKKDGHRDPQLLPRGGAHNGGTDPDTWSYARQDRDEYGAELYSKAIVAPELLYADLMTTPAQRLNALILQGASPADIQLAARQLHAGAEQITRLRQDVFKLSPGAIDDKRSALEQHAQTKGLSVADTQKLLAGFDAASVQVMTPEQLEALYSNMAR